MAAIEVSGLRKSYGDVVAVDGVDITIESGEVFALLGPNGAGKTTTVEILEGIAPPMAAASAYSASTLRQVAGLPGADRDRPPGRRGRTRALREALSIYGSMYPGVSTPTI